MNIPKLNQKLPIYIKQCENKQYKCYIGIESDREPLKYKTRYFNKLMVSVCIICLVVLKKMKHVCIYTKQIKLIIFRTKLDDDVEIILYFKTKLDDDEIKSHT